MLRGFSLLHQGVGPQNTVAFLLYFSAFQAARSCKTVFRGKKRQFQTGRYCEAVSRLPLPLE